MHGKITSKFWKSIHLVEDDLGISTASKTTDGPRVSRVSPLGDHVTRTDDKLDQPSGGETTSLDKYWRDPIWQRTAQYRLTWRRHAESFAQPRDTTATQWLLFINWQSDIFDTFASIYCKTFKANFCNLMGPSTKITYPRDKWPVCSTAW